MRKDIALAYIAGLVDGEAYIGIKRTKAYKNLTGRINPSFQERIQVRMVDKEAIEFIADTLGGWYYREKPSSKNGRPLYCYQASDKSAAEILQSLLPYLRVKRAQAEVVLKLRANKELPRSETTSLHKVTCKNRWGQMQEVNRRMLSDETIAHRQSLYERCKELNATGI